MNESLQQFLDRHRSPLIYVGSFSLATVATLPYFQSTSLTTSPILAYLGMFPWLFAHPLRLLAMVPALLFTLTLIRAP